MKARVKATGKIVEISTFQDNAQFPTIYDENELEFLIPNDYWTRLEHQYAGMAMQGILSNYDLYGSVIRTGQVSDIAKGYAHDLVEKYKEKEERK